MIELTGKGLTPAEVVAVARADEEVELAAEAREAMAESAAIVERLASSSFSFIVFVAIWDIELHVLNTDEHPPISV